jgi:nicotinamide riboside transporter PnuC
MIKILGYIAITNTIITVYLTGDKNIIIWWLSILNQCIWAYIGWKTNQSYLIVMAVALQVLNIRGLVKWSKLEQSK